MNYSQLVKNFPELFTNVDAPFKIITDAHEIRSWQSGQRTNKKIGIIYSDPYILIIRDLVEFPDSHRDGITRVVSVGELSGKHGIAVLGQFEGKIMLLKNYRNATRQWHLEIPRGYAENKLTTEQNVINELSEEAGAAASEIISLGLLYVNTGLEQSPASLFFARLLKIGYPETQEGIAGIVLLSPTEIENLISNSSITDCYTIAAYTRAKLKGLLT
jgi:ADP-ribose pyrophosphatase